TAHSIRVRHMIGTCEERRSAPRYRSIEAEYPLEKGAVTSDYWIMLLYLPWRSRLERHTIITRSHSVVRGAYATRNASDGEAPGRKIRHGARDGRRYAAMACPRIGVENKHALLLPQAHQHPALFESVTIMPSRRLRGDLRASHHPARSA